MNIRKHIPGAIAAALAFAVLPSCQDDMETPGNSIFAPTTETVSTVNVKPSMTEATGYVEANLAKKEDRDIKVTFEANADRVDS